MEINNLHKIKTYNSQSITHYLIADTILKEIKNETNPNFILKI